MVKQIRALNCTCPDDVAGCSACASNDWIRWCDGCCASRLGGTASSLFGLLDPRVCRGCGCTDAMACPGGCSWVEDDLCSRCAGLAPLLADEDAPIHDAVTADSLAGLLSAG